MKVEESEIGAAQTHNGREAAAQANLRRQLRSAYLALFELEESWAWKFIRPWRTVFAIIQGVVFQLQELARLSLQVLHVWFTEGTRACLRKLWWMLRSVLQRRLGWRPATPEAAAPVEQIMAVRQSPSPSLTRALVYQLWASWQDGQGRLGAWRNLRRLSYQPLISILMPVYNPPPGFLSAALRSVRAQAYSRWELCICDDGSSDARVKAVLDEWASRESRIKLQRLPVNAGITAASNAALALATGEFIVLMDHDDELAPQALYEVARQLNLTEADLVYSDEDKLSVHGRRYDPFFKPDWSPDLFLSCNYLNHLTVLRATLMRAVGGFQPGYEGAQDYDLYLRMIEKTARIQHIARILYHWRAVPASAASSPQAKPAAHPAAQRAITDHLARLQVPAIVEPGYVAGRWRVRYHVPDSLAVAIIIPTARSELLTSCLEALAQTTDAQKVELAVVDNSQADAVRLALTPWEGRFERVHYLDCRDQPFNFSALNNQAAACTVSPLLLFLNDDTQPLDSDWLPALVEQAQRPEVGAVGAKLIYPDGTLQHAGIVMGLFGNAGHAFKYHSADVKQPIYFDLPHVIRNCSAVTAACLMTRRAVFEAAGGFDEVHLAVAFQDVDLCLKLQQAGYRVVYTPYARLTHYESKSKTRADLLPARYEVRHMQQKWAAVIAHDPYYNSNLSRLNESFTLALPS
jgi:O-antigen biosynthesis protein